MFWYYKKKYTVQCIQQWMACVCFPGLHYYLSLPHANEPLVMLYYNYIKLHSHSYVRRSVNVWQETSIERQRREGRGCLENKMKVLLNTYIYLTSTAYYSTNLLVMLTVLIMCGCLSNFYINFFSLIPFFILNHWTLSGCSKVKALETGEYVWCKNSPQLLSKGRYSPRKKSGVRPKTVCMK